MAQTFDEDIRGGLIAFPKGEVQNELRVAFDCNEAISIAHVRVIIGRAHLFLLANEAPYFIRLYVAHGNVNNQPAHQRFALFASERQDFHDRVAVQIRYALRAANGIAFDEQAKRENDPILGDVASGQGGFMGLGIGLFAQRAAKSAKAIPVFAEALTVRFALLASHWFCCRFYCALHDSIIQLSLVVCQRKTAYASGYFVFTLSYL